MVGCDFNPRWFWTKDIIKRVLNTIPSLDAPIYHICSGVSNLGNIRMDRSYIDLPFDNKYWIDYQGSCNVKGDMLNIPFKSAVAGSVICDPPYDYDFTDSKLIDELVRICKPKAKILFIAPWIPANKNISLINTEVWKVGKNRPYVKIRSLLYKSNGQLSDYA